MQERKALRQHIPCQLDSIQELSQLCRRGIELKNLPMISQYYSNHTLSDSQHMLFPPDMSPDYPVLVTDPAVAAVNEPETSKITIGKSIECHSYSKVIGTTVSTQHNTRESLSGCMYRRFTNITCSCTKYFLVTPIQAIPLVD